MVNSTMRGSSLLELVMATALCVVLLVGSGAAIFGSIQSASALSEQDELFKHAQTLLNRVYQLPFGEAGSPTPQASLMQSFFDLSEENYDVSICQLSEGKNKGTWRWKDSTIKAKGFWKLVLSQDIDKNGEISGPLENSKKIFRIKIHFEDQLILETIRSHDTQ